MIHFGNAGVAIGKLLGFKLSPVPKGFSSMGDFSPRDVFIVGYPRSGNTWFQNLVCGVVHGLDPRLSLLSLVEDLVPDVHSHAFFRRYSTPAFFKSHALPCPEYRRVVYLMRDGRDAMVSYLHFLESIEGRRLDFLKLVQTGQNLFPCKWHEHVEAWLANPHGAELLVIRYEDLVMEPLEQLERFCRFIELPREREFLAAVADNARFRHLRKKEALLGMPGPAWPRNKRFFRRGVVGSHRDEMPADVLAAFLREATPTLRRHQYQVEAPDAVVVPELEAALACTESGNAQCGFTTGHPA